MRSKLIFSFVFISILAKAQLYIRFDSLKNKYGYADSTEKLIIPFIYDYANEFGEKTALVREDSTYSVINKKGKKLYRFVQHNGIGPSIVPDRYFYCSGQDFIVYDSIGKVVFKQKADLFNRWGENNYPGLWAAKIGNKVGFVRTDGSISIPIEYETDNYQETFMVDGNLYFPDSALFKLKHDGKWGIMDMYGKVILPFEYESLETVQYDPRETTFLFAAGIKDGKRIFVNSQMKNIEMDFDTCAGFFNIMTQAVLIKGNKPIFYDVLKHALVDSFPFVYYRDNEHGRGSTGKELHALKINYKGKCMIINTKKQVIYPLSDNPAEAFYLNGKVFFSIMEKGKNMFALFDSKLKQLTPFNFTSINANENNIYGSDTSEKEFFISDKGVLTPVR